VIHCSHHIALCHCIFGQLLLLYLSFVKDLHSVKFLIGMLLYQKNLTKWPSSQKLMCYKVFRSYLLSWTYNSLFLFLVMIVNFVICLIWAKYWCFTFLWDIPLLVVLPSAANRRLLGFLSLIVIWFQICWRVRRWKTCVKLSELWAGVSRALMRQYLCNCELCRPFRFLVRRLLLITDLQVVFDLLIDSYLPWNKTLLIPNIQTLFRKRHKKLD